MKLRGLILGLLLTTMIPGAVLAQGAEGVESFKQERDSWRRKETTTAAPEVTPQMRDSIPAQALKNITAAEQAFCYTVEAAAPDFTGYTLDGMEITGFCGILSQAEKDLFIGEFLSKESNVSNVVEKCIIQPRIMLRFVHGVDYTDVLFSSPCHSFSVFYAGRIKSFNTSPASQLVDAIVTAYEKKRVGFVSPALLNQVLPIGFPDTDEQKALINEKKAQKPVRNWNTKPQKPAPASAAPAAKGWNRLKN